MKGEISMTYQCAKKRMVGRAVVASGRTINALFFANSRPALIDRKGSFAGLANGATAARP
jgi:hypothetical protein